MDVAGWIGSSMSFVPDRETVRLVLNRDDIDSPANPRYGYKRPKAIMRNTSPAKGRKGLTP
jgi:hypothetical protein